MKAHAALSFLFLFLALHASPSIPLSLPQIPASLDGLVAGVWTNFSSLLDAGIGDARDAVIPLKKYFARFGYLNLNLTGQNVTDLFDADLLSAVKLYQESFNLTVSGKLDLKTLIKIMTPRCGREDVIDGIPLMLQSSTPGVAASHVVGHYAFFPTQPKWPSTRRNLTYAFSSSNETDRVSSDQRRQTFASAFDEWAAVVPINFTEISDFDEADIKIEFAFFDHGDGEPFDGLLGVLAHAFSPTDGRFHLDDSEYWRLLTTTKSQEPQDVDLQSVVTHEIGHLIGLAHTSVEDAIMYPSIAPGQVKLKLQPDDIEGAQALYGANPDYNPESPLPGVPNTVEDVSRAYALEIISSVSLLGCFLLCLAVLM